MSSTSLKCGILLAICLFFVSSQQAQSLTRELKLTAGAKISVTNNFGRVSVRSIESQDPPVPAGTLTATARDGVSESEVKIAATTIEVKPASPQKRIDLIVTVPERTFVKIETRDGQVEVSGDLASIEVSTATGTIVVGVPTDGIDYILRWTESRPRYVADFDLEKIKEKSGGRFEIKGTYSDDGTTKRSKKVNDPDETTGDADLSDAVKKPKSKDRGGVSLDLTTARGIILINVPPNEVGSDLRERPLTEAAKAIVRSGDSLLMEAIRRAAPKYYGDYTCSMPPIKFEPTFSERVRATDGGKADVKTALVRVTDLKNRAIPDLSASDFVVTEGGEQREITNVTESTARSFNLVLLLDVSGSVENYVTFIRKAARAFVGTVDKKDRVSIVIFNDDVKVLSKFTTDKGKLSESLDTFDAGGATAYFDALAFTVADTLRPLKGERTAIVILTDGEDNRSFLAFDSLIGSIQESGALIYPLYVPSGLIAEAASGNTDIDPMRKRYMSLSSKAEGEGQKLAKISGGVYYPITRVDEIQRAYEDIVVQLRTAYNVTFRSATSTDNGASPRLKIRTKRDNAFVTISSVVPAVSN